MIDFINSLSATQQAFIALVAYSFALHLALRLNAMDYVYAPLYRMVELNAKEISKINTVLPSWLYACSAILHLAFWYVIMVLFNHGELSMIGLGKIIAFELGMFAVATLSAYALVYQLFRNVKQAA